MKSIILLAFLFIYCIAFSQGKLFSSIKLRTKTNNCTFCFKHSNVIHMMRVLSIVHNWMTLLKHVTVTITNVTKELMLLV